MLEAVTIQIDGNSRAPANSNFSFGSGKAATDLTLAGDKAREAATRMIPSSNQPIRLSQQMQSLEGALFEAKSQAKQLTAAIAMHLSRNWRDRFFSQVDDLLDVEEWDDRDPPIAAESFRTFVRLNVYLQSTEQPSLGASMNGDLIAVWRRDEDRLTIYCGPNDNLRWIIRWKPNSLIEHFERAVGDNTSTQRMQQILGAYGGSAHWGFGNALSEGR